MPDRPPRRDDSFPRLVHRGGEHPDAVEVWEHEGTRWLQFPNGPIQSRMMLARPHALTLAYTRAMMAALLFVDEPERAVIVGLGGGSIVRFLHHHYPAMRLVAIERDPAVAEVATEHFALPSDAVDLRIGDAREPSTDYGPPADLLAVDVFEPAGLPRWMCEARVHARFRAALAEHGILACNLWVEDDDEFLDVMAGMRDAFDGRTLVSTVDGYRNLVAFAFVGEPRRLGLADLRTRATELSARFGFDLVASVDAMARVNPVEHGTLVL